MGVLTETEEERRQMEAMRTGEPVDPPSTPTPPPEPPPAVQPTATQRPAEPVKVPTPQPAPQPPPRREVEHGAFHAERERRRELERELAELRAERAAAAQRATAPQRQPIPDPQQDPIGSMQHMQQRIAEFEERDRRMAAEQERQREEAERFRAVQKRVQPRIDAYMAEHPEYADQVTYVRNARGRELMRLGASRQEAEQTVIAEEMQLLRLMDERELDPGELISGLAQDRGWRPGQSIAPPGQGAPNTQPQGNGYTEPPPRARVTPSAADRIERGRQAARSSTGTGGQGPPPEMTVERLAELDGAEFDKAFALHAKRLIG